MSTSAINAIKYTAADSELYQRIFDRLRAEQNASGATLPAPAVVRLMRGSGVGRERLQKIWQICCSNRDEVTAQEFFAVLRLLVLAQKDEPFSLSSANSATGAPSIVGMDLDALPPARAPRKPSPVTDVTSAEKPRPEAAHKKPSSFLQIFEKQPEAAGKRAVPAANSHQIFPDTARGRALAEPGAKSPGRGGTATAGRAQVLSFPRSAAFPADAVSASRALFPRNAGGGDVRLALPVSPTELASAEAFAAQAGLLAEGGLAKADWSRVCENVDAETAAQLWKLVTEAEDTRATSGQILAALILAAGHREGKALPTTLDPAWRAFIASYGAGNPPHRRRFSLGTASPAQRRSPASLPLAAREDEVVRGLEEASAVCRAERAAQTKVQARIDGLVQAMQEELRCLEQWGEEVAKQMRLRHEEAKLLRERQAREWEGAAIATQWCLDALSKFEAQHRSVQAVTPLPQKSADEARNDSSLGDGGDPFSEHYLSLECTAPTKAAAQQSKRLPGVEAAEDGDATEEVKTFASTLGRANPPDSPCANEAWLESWTGHAGVIDRHIESRLHNIVAPEVPEPPAAPFEEELLQVELVPSIPLQPLELLSPTRQPPDRLSENESCDAPEGAATIENDNKSESSADGGGRSANTDSKGKDEQQSELRGTENSMESVSSASARSQERLEQTPIKGELIGDSTLAETRGTILYKDEEDSAPYIDIDSLPCKERPQREDCLDGVEARSETLGATPGVPAAEPDSPPRPRAYSMTREGEDHSDAQ